MTIVSLLTYENTDRFETANVDARLTFGAQIRNVFGEYLMYASD